jgi:hypothetical protein
MVVNILLWRVTAEQDNMQAGYVEVLLPTLAEGR